MAPGATRFAVEHEELLVAAIEGLERDDLFDEPAALELIEEGIVAVVAAARLAHEEESLATVRAHAS